MSIDVFPRLHERDPYRWLLQPHVSYLQGPLLLSSDEAALMLSMLDCYWTVIGLCCRRLGVGRDSSFEEVQDARNYLYDVRTAYGACML